jgi:HSP20 family protein
VAESTPHIHKEAGEATPAESTRGGIYFTPRVDIFETRDDLVFQCDVPGVKPDDVNLRFEKGELSLHAKVAPRQRPKEYLTAEYGVGDFYRSFGVGVEVEADKIAAEYAQGVLTIRLPKAEKIKPRQIPIKAK